MYTVGHWSPSRPAVFFIGKEDGSIEVWDLLEKSHEPSLTQNISTASITSIKSKSISRTSQIISSIMYFLIYFITVVFTVSEAASSGRIRPPRHAAHPSDSLDAPQIFSQWGDISWKHACQDCARDAVNVDYVGHSVGFRWYSELSVCLLQMQIVRKYFEREEERLNYFEKRQTRHENVKKEMDTGEQRKKTVSSVRIK